MEDKSVKPDLQVEVQKGMKLKKCPWGYVAEKPGLIVGSQKLEEIPELINWTIYAQKL